MSLNRRDFLKSGLGLASAASLASAPVFSWMTSTAQGAGRLAPLSVASGESPADNVQRAIQALGGIEKFVKKGSTVFLKPNSISNLGEEYAINTNPAVVREVAKLCRLAGASKVIAVSHDEASPWEANGIGSALTAEGATWRVANDQADYQTVKLPLGLLLRETAVIKELLEADVFINIPVAKHHAGSRLTIGMKNYMGLNWDRLVMHNTDLQQCIADLVSVRRPDLTVVDCTRILLTNGPGGPGTVRQCNQVIASPDLVAADAYAATLFKLEPRAIGHIRYGNEMGLGEMDTKKMDVRMV